MISSSDSDCEKSNGDASERESVVLLAVSIAEVTEVSDLLQVADSHPGLRTAILEQNTRHKAVVLSIFDWTSEPVEYFELFF